LIQEQLKHFQLQKFRSIFKNIFNSDENVRILSVYMLGCHKHIQWLKDGIEKKMAIKISGHVKMGS